MEYRIIHAALWSLISQLFAILSLRNGPQILPASQPLLSVLVALNLLLSVTVLLSGLPLGQALLLVTSSLGLGLLFCYFALYLRGFSSRFLQTAIALIGTDILISLVSLPLSLAVVQQLWVEGATELAPELAFGLLVLTAWMLAVVGGIFRHALNLPWPAALAVALAYVIVTASISL